MVGANGREVENSGRTLEPCVTVLIFPTKALTDSAVYLWTACKDFDGAQNGSVEASGLKQSFFFQYDSVAFFRDIDKCN